MGGAVVASLLGFVQALPTTEEAGRHVFDGDFQPQAEANGSATARFGLRHDCRVLAVQQDQARRPARRVDLSGGPGRRGCAGLGRQPGDSATARRTIGGSNSGRAEVFPVVIGFSEVFRSQESGVRMVITVYQCLF